MNKSGVLILFLIGFNTLIIAQNSSLQILNIPELNISFECPNNWSYSFERGSEMIRVFSTDTNEQEIYNDCFDSVIVYIEATNLSLDSTLLPDEFYIKKNETYYSDFSYMSTELVECDLIKSNTLNGIHHFNQCRIKCRSDNVTPLVESCEFIHLSNGIRTISFSTGGRELDNSVRETIISSLIIK